MEEPGRLQISPVHACFSKGFEQRLILTPLALNLFRVSTQSISKGYEGLRTLYRITIGINQIPISNAIRSIVVQALYRPDINEGMFVILAPLVKLNPVR